MTEPTAPSRDADAAWEALAEDVIWPPSSDRNARDAFARHRPLIEAAVRASGSPTDAALVEAAKEAARVAFDASEPESDYVTVRAAAWNALFEAVIALRAAAPRPEPLDVGSVVRRKA